MIGSVVFATFTLAICVVASLFSNAHRIRRHSFKLLRPHMRLNCLVSIFAMLLGSGAVFHNDVVMSCVWACAGSRHNPSCVSLSQKENVVLCGDRITQCRLRIS